MLDTAFPADNQLVQNYENCSVDLIPFDRDLDDFKCVLAHFEKREGKYFDTMEVLTEFFSNLNYEWDGFYEEIEEYDKDLLESIEEPSIVEDFAG